MSGKVDAGKPRRLGRGLSSLMQVEVPVEVTSRHEQNTNESGPTVPAGPPLRAAALSSPAGSPSAAAGSALPPAATADAAGEREGGIRQVPVSSIDPNRYQPRRVFDQEQLKGLSDSIRRSGLMQPVVVRPAPRGGAGTGPNIDGDRYELVAGERRWRAAMLAELRSIPAIVRDLTDIETAEWAIVENVQRADLNPVERAEAYRALADRFGLTQAMIAERVGLDRSSVANFIRLTELEPAVLELIGGGALSAGHGKALLGCPPGDGRVQLAKRAAAAGWNVRQLEASAKLIQNSGTQAGPSGEQAADGPAAMREAGVRDLERRLGEFLGTKVCLQTNAVGTRGKLVVDFYGLDHFDGLMSKIGFRGT